MRSIFNDVTLQNERSIPIAKIQMISINYIAYGITLYHTDGEALILKEYFNDDDADLHAIIAVNEQNLSIRHGAQRVFGFTRGYIELYLPKTFYGTLNIQTISGKIDIRCKLSLDEFNASSTSGKILVEDITTGSAVLSTVSGGIYIGMIRANCNLHSTSGSLRVNCAAGCGMFQTVSGSIEAFYETVLGDIRMHTTSGRIRLSLPVDFPFKLNARSVSGGIHTDFPMRQISGGNHSLAGQSGNAPSSNLDLCTVSGKIEILSET